VKCLRFQFSVVNKFHCPNAQTGAAVDIVPEIILFSTGNANPASLENKRVGRNYPAPDVHFQLGQPRIIPNLFYLKRGKNQRGHRGARVAWRQLTLAILVNLLKSWVRRQRNYRHKK
jgi:hypothetical protein